MKKLFIYMLVFVVLFAFTIQPVQKAHAAALPLATYFGGIAAAEAFLGWLLLMDKLGVQFNALEEAEKLYENWQLENMNEPVDPQPPEGQTPQRDWLRWVLGIATGATLLDSIGDLFVDVKSWLEGLFGTLQEGNNTISGGNDTLIYSPGIFYKNIGIGSHTFVVDNYSIYVELDRRNGNEIWFNAYDRLNNPSGGRIAYSWDSNYTVNIYAKLQPDNKVYFYGNSSLTSVIASVPILNLDIYTPQEELTATITSDAPILNPSYSPPITPIPPALPALSTLDPDNEKIGIVPAPDGTMKQIYEGTYEDYFKDYVENVTWDDLQNPTLPRTTIQEGTDSQGNPIIIINPSVNSPAFPNPNTDPEADTGVFQGTLIGLTQIVINWLKLIWEAITAIPQAIYNLFVPEPGYFGGQVDILKGKLLGKFDNESAINFLEGLDNIQPKPIPDLYYKENIILEADFVNDMAPYIKSWLNFFLYVGIALASMNFFYKLIRGTNAIDIHAYDQKGSR